MIRTGIPTNAYFRVRDYEEGLKKVKQHGFDCVDFRPFFNYTDEIHSLSDAELFSYATAVSDCANKNDVTIWQMHASWGHGKTGKIEEFTKERLYKEIEFAEKLNCKYMVCHPYLWQLWVENPPKISSEEVFAVNMELFKELALHAKKHGVILCVENLPLLEHKICYVDELKRFLDEICNDNVQACFDTGHSNVIGNDIYDDILTLGKYIKVLHVHDAMCGQDRHLTPYQGSINWDRFICGLNDIGFKGVISLETEIKHNTPEPIKTKMQIILSEIARHLASKVNP